MSEFEITFPFSSSHSCLQNSYRKWDSVSGIATCYGLRGPGCEPCGGENFGPV
jgi:hypothetical protein